MSDKVIEVKGTGISICSALGVAFIILKLLDKIDWSWWWVTAPFWGPVVLAAAIYLGFLLLITFVALCLRK